MLGEVRVGIENDGCWIIQEGGQKLGPYASVSEEDPLYSRDGNFVYRRFIVKKWAILDYVSEDREYLITLDEPQSVSKHSTYLNTFSERLDWRYR